MKKFTFLLVLSVGFWPCLAKAQVDTVTHPTNFSTTDQGLWGPGTAQTVNLNIPLFSTPNLNGGFSYGDIVDIAGMDFGAELSANTWAHFGSGLTIKAGGEKVDLDYNSKVEITVPQSGAFDRGQEVVLNTKLIPQSGQIPKDEYDIIFDLWFDYDLGVEFDGEICVFSCIDFPAVDIDIDGHQSLLHVTPDNLEVIGGYYAIPDVLLDNYYDEGKITLACPPPPIDISAPPFVCAFSIELSLPSNNSESVSNDFDEDILYSKAAPFEYVKLGMSIPGFLGELVGLSPDPGSQAVSQVLTNLSNSWAYEDFSVSYTYLDAGLSYNLFHNQTLRFDPNMYTQMEFPTMVDYKIVNPINNQVVSQGRDSIISFEVGNQIKFKYPCNYEFMEIQSNYSVATNQFSNHTYDSLSFQFFLDELAISGGIPKIVVIPDFCVDIPYPCPTWSNPTKWCSEEVCTPEVTFGPISFDYGPLITYRHEFADLKYDWTNRTWPLGGFDTIHAVNAFRLTPKPYQVAASATPISCFGMNSSTVTVNVTNGQPPYTYEWSAGNPVTSYSNPFTINNLGAGTQYVMVTDAKGCQTFTDVIVNQPVAALAVNANITHAGCNGVNSGSIDLIPAGGTAPYTYNWSSGQNTQDLTAITSGTYWVTVKDLNGCSSLHSYTVQQPLPLAVSQVSSDITCYGEATGTASVIASGGIPPYAYSWSSGDSLPLVAALAAGTYHVSVTDFNGCLNTQDITIAQPADGVSISVTSQDVLCYGGSSGFMHVTPSGGTAPYSCTWYNQNGQIINQNAVSLDSVTPGNYLAVITDQQGCHFDTTLSIFQPAQIAWSFATMDNRCFGESAGTAEITVNGGFAPYEYTWSNGSDSSALTSLAAGTYAVTITDSNGCVQHSSVMINQPAAAVAASVTPLQILCFGQPTGAADLIPSGGTPPYTFHWSNGAQTEDLSDLLAGTYTVTITDANLCEGYSGTTIVQPTTALNVGVTVANAICDGLNNGSILVSASGGTTPYYIRWDNTDYLFSNSGHRIDNLGEGTYQLIVTDANGCQNQQMITITAPEALQLEATSTLVHCFAGTDGSIDLTATGGTLPYVYHWSNGHTSEDLSGIGAGYYTVTVTDAGSCASVLNVEVKGMTEITVKGNITPISCVDNADGKISVTANGGAGGYTYLWSNGSGLTQLDKLATGDLSLVVTDVYGCSRSFEFFIPGSEMACISIPTSFTPNGDGTNDLWVVRNIDLYSGNNVKIFNRWGNLMYEASPYAPAWDGTFNGNPVPAETYYYIINLNNGTEPFNGTVTIIR